MRSDSKSQMGRRSQRKIIIFTTLLLLAQKIFVVQKGQLQAIREDTQLLHKITIIEFEAPALLHVESFSGALARSGGLDQQIAFEFLRIDYMIFHLVAVLIHYLDELLEALLDGIVSMEFSQKRAVIAEAAGTSTVEDAVGC